MREICVAPLVPAAPDDNLTDLVVRNGETAPDRAGFARRVDGRWQDVTYAEFLDEVRGLARGLVAAGVQPGARVGLMCRTRYEWTALDFAIWFAGAVTVPVYETSAPEQVAWILADSGAVGILVESPAHRATVEGVRGDLPELRHLWCLEPDAGPDGSPDGSPDGGAMAELTASGRDVPDEEIERRRRSLNGASIATLIYTSGTTGRPKGCELTHANFLELSRNTFASLRSVVGADGASTMLFLPLAHVFARFIQVLCIDGQAKLGHSPDVKNLLDDLGQFRPSFVLAVPRVFEKIYNSAAATADAGGKGRIFAAAASTAIDYSEALEGRGPGIVLRLRHALFDRLLYAKIRERLGGRVQNAVSGGAPLGPRLGHFFRGIGVTVLEGYGLTETTAPASVNTPDRIKVGTVGRPLPGVCMAVAPDGELLIRGVNVMAGYFNNPEATAAVLDADGWFHTGDLGEIDDDGFVTITGRKKELIVTAGGKNVVPSLLEDRLRAHPLVSQCIVVGDQRPFIGCLVTLDSEMLPAWLAARGRPAMDVATAATDPVVRAEVEAAVNHANEAVSRAESIRKFLILDTDFTESSGHLTPKHSIKRQTVLKDFADKVEELYR